MNGWMNEKVRVHGWMDGWMEDGWMDGKVKKWTSLWTIDDENAHKSCNDK